VCGLTVAERAGVITLGSRIGYDGRTWMVVAIQGLAVTLQSAADGQLAAVLVSHLLTAIDFVLLDQPQVVVSVPADSLLEGLPPAEQHRVRRLEAHLIELEDDPAQSTESDAAGRPRLAGVQERMAAKVEELAGTDLAVGIRQLHRLRTAYRADGSMGLVEGRLREQLTGRNPFRGFDDRVVTAMREAMSHQVNGSTITRKTMFIQVREALTKAHGEQLQVPADRDLYRLAALLDQGQHTFGAATTRRTNDNRPERPFTSSVTLRPGEQVQIDTNTIDIMCRYADGIARRAELTITVDVATRTILAGVIAPSTKAVDATAVLARMVVPQPLRPGWPESLLLARSGLPFESLVSLDARFEQAQALPVILPDTLVCDRGSIYMSETFLRACRYLGISVQPARPYTPTDKGVVERTFSSINTLFCQHIHGYVGSSVAMRGKDPAAEAVFNVAQLQELFDEWVVAVWQNRPHESLTSVWGQGRSVSPNEAYAAMLAQAGHLPLPRSAADFVELLPSAWRRINQEGVTFDNRVYDTAALNRYRQANSGVKAQNGRWELHHDPYDVTAVWIRNHHAGGWITATWIHRDLVAQPFSAAIYEHVRARSTAAGTPVRDDYIARRVAEMLHPGIDAAQQSPTDRRLVAAERNNPPRPPHLVVVPGSQETPTEGDQTSDHGQGDSGNSAVQRKRKVRKVVGFGVFDPTADDWRYR